MFDEEKTPEFTNDDLANAVQAHLWHEGFGEIGVYDNTKIITDDRGARRFDEVFDEALNILLYGQSIEETRKPSIKAMVESLHNHLVGLEKGDEPDTRWDTPATPYMN